MAIHKSESSDSAVIMSGSSLSNALLLAFVLATALAVIYSSHQSRLLFGDLLDLQKHAFDMDDEWGRLLIERRTHASVDRVEKIALEDLSMEVPTVQLMYVGAKE
jgi:cell division protein FtsL